MLSVSSATSTRVHLVRIVRRRRQSWRSRSAARPAQALSASAGHRDALVQPVPFELAVERAPADAEHASGDRLVAAHLLQRADDVIALDVDEQRGRSVEAGRRRGRCARAGLDAAASLVSQRPPRRPGSRIRSSDMTSHCGLMPRRALSTSRQITPRPNECRGWRGRHRRPGDGGAGSAWRMLQPAHFEAAIWRRTVRARAAPT